MSDYILYHSYKGSSWKKHKYISKQKKNGKTNYKYNNFENPFAGVNPDDYSGLENWFGIDEYDNYKKYKNLEKEADEGMRNTNNLLEIGVYALAKEQAKYLKEQAEVKLNETLLGVIRKGALFISDLVSTPFKAIKRGKAKNS